MGYWGCLALCCQRCVMSQRYQQFDIKYGISTIYYHFQDLFCIGTWENSLKTFAVLLIMDRPIYRGTQSFLKIRFIYVFTEV